MIYLFYVEDDDGYTIQQCRDEIHYLDLLVDIESRAVIVPYDIRWHGDGVAPPMRILAIHDDNADLSHHTADIIRSCGLWLRQN